MQGAITRKDRLIVFDAKPDYTAWLVKGLEVKKDYRQNGIGKCIWKKLEKDAKKARVSLIVDKTWVTEYGFVFLVKSGYKHLLGNDARLTLGRHYLSLVANECTELKITTQKRAIGILKRPGAISEKYAKLIKSDGSTFNLISSNSPQAEYKPPPLQGEGLKASQAAN